jgi:hypothetical protein
MQGNHRDVLNGQKSLEWLNVAEKTRAGDHSRKEAYQAFAKLRTTGLLAGMGPAFFTKLIFFLMPRRPNDPSPGYIMDQWVGCAVNVLAGRQVVLMNCTQSWTIAKRGQFQGQPSLSADYTVSDANDERCYEDFCCYIEKTDALLSQSGLSRKDYPCWKDPSWTELQLLSEGRDAHSWRRYIIEQRRPPHPIERPINGKLSA